MSTTEASKRSRECSVEELQSEGERKTKPKQGHEEECAGVTGEAYCTENEEEYLRVHQKVYSILEDAYPDDECFTPVFPLIREYPDLLSEPYDGKTIMARFLQQEAPPHLIQALCLLHKEKIPELKNGRFPKCKWRKWREDSEGFCREPNFVTDACLYGYPEVLEIILKEFPHQLKQKDADNKILPVEYLLKCFLPVDEDTTYEFHVLDRDPPNDLLIIETVECLLEVWPTMFDFCQGDSVAKMVGKDGFRLGVAAQYFLKKFIERPQGIESVDVHPQNLTSRMARALSQALPKTQHFMVRAFHTHENVGSIFLQELHRAVPLPALKSLELPIFPTLLARKDPQLMLFDSVQKCCHLQKLALSFQKKADVHPLDDGAEDAESESEEGPDEYNLQKECLEFVGTLVTQANPGIQELRLSSLCLEDATVLGHALSQVLQAKTALKTLSFWGLRLNGLAVWPRFDIPQHCQIQQIQLQAVDMNDDWVSSLLFQLCDLPCLQLLDIQQAGGGTRFNRSGTTRAIAAILQKNRLEELKLTDLRGGDEVTYGISMSFDLRYLSNALQHNNSLVHLEVNRRPDKEAEEILAGILEHQNRTLEKVTFYRSYGPPLPSEGNARSKIFYYTALNRFGRPRLEDQTGASLQDLVEAMDQANRIYSAQKKEKEADSDSDSDRNESESELDSSKGDWRQVTLYALLRMAPSLWSSNSSTVVSTRPSKRQSRIREMDCKEEVGNKEGENNKNNSRSKQQSNDSDAPAGGDASATAATSKTCSKPTPKRTSPSSPEKSPEEDGPWLFQTRKWKRANFSGVCTTRKAARTGNSSPSGISTVPGERNEMKLGKEQEGKGEGIVLNDHKQKTDMEECTKEALSSKCQGEDGDVHLASDKCQGKKTNSVVTPEKPADKDVKNGSNVENKVEDENGGKNHMEEPADSYRDDDTPNNGRRSVLGAVTDMEDQEEDDHSNVVFKRSRDKDESPTISVSPEKLAEKDVKKGSNTEAVAEGDKGGRNHMENADKDDETPKKGNRSVLEVTTDMEDMDEGNHSHTLFVSAEDKNNIGTSSVTPEKLADKDAEGGSNTEAIMEDDNEGSNHVSEPTDDHDDKMFKKGNKSVLELVADDYHAAVQRTNDSDDTGTTAVAQGESDDEEGAPEGDDSDSRDGSDSEEEGGQEDASWSTLDRARQREQLNLPEGSFEGSCCIQ